MKGSLSAKALVRKVAEDRESASTIMQYVLKDLLSIADEGMPDEDWEATALGLRHAKPSMAPMFNVANGILMTLEDGGDLVETLEGIKRMEDGSLEKIAHFASGLGGKRIMTISYSGTVLTALRGMEVKEVVVAESLPMGEGRSFAKRLASEGMACEVIPDSMVFTCMDEVDGAIVGADAITPEGGVNKVGTLAMAMAAIGSGKMLAVLAGWSKVCPVDLSDLERERRQLAPDIWDVTQLYERFPLEEATIVTDRGSMDHYGLAKEFADWRMARILRPGQTK